jgi:hypothetical protein
MKTFEFNLGQLLSGIIILVTVSYFIGKYGIPLI